MDQNSREAIDGIVTELSNTMLQVKRFVATETDSGLKIASEWAESLSTACENLRTKLSQMTDDKEA